MWFTGSPLHGRSKIESRYVAPWLRGQYAVQRMGVRKREDNTEHWSLVLDKSRRTGAHPQGRLRQANEGRGLCQASE